MDLCKLLSDSKKSAAALTFFKSSVRSEKLKKDDLWLLLGHLYEIVPSEIKSSIVNSTGETSSQLDSQNEDSSQSSAPGQNTNVTQICQKYRHGNCPHGLLGRECDFAHPKKCHRFKKFGSNKMDKRGCGLGKECKFFHPVVCKTSIRGQDCRDNSCKRQHLKRKPPKNDVEQNLKKHNKPEQTLSAKNSK